MCVWGGGGGEGGIPSKLRALIKNSHFHDSRILETSLFYGKYFDQRPVRCVHVQLASIMYTHTAGGCISNNVSRGVCVCFFFFFLLKKERKYSAWCNRG